MIRGWMLNSSRDDFGLHQGEKNVRVTMKFKVHIRYIKSHISHDLVMSIGSARLFDFLIRCLGPPSRVHY